MTVEGVDVAVIGAGAAGLSAAGEAARLGARVALLDDNRQPGGQYFRQPPADFGAAATSKRDKDRARFEELRAGIDSPLISFHPGATVWDVPDPLTLAVANGPRSGRIEARAIVIAAGACDRAVAFPGWTLPGVISAGGLQNLIKGMGIAPPGPVVVAGNGPLLLVAAASLVRAGVRVAAVVESAKAPARSLREAAKLVCAPSILRRAAEYRAILLKVGTPILYGKTIVAAQGDAELADVEIAAIDNLGRIDRRDIRRLEARTLVTGYGLTPCLELPRLLGAEEDRLPLRGGSTLRRDARLMTSVPGVFAAGDGAAIGGVEISLIEGRIAGIEAAVYAGTVARESVQFALARQRKTHRRLDQFRTGLERVFAPPASWLGLLTPETIICRCEDVALCDLEARMTANTASPLTLKAATRIGMGRCQGRNCLDALAAILSERQGVSAQSIHMPRARPPARPILLGDLLHEDLPAPELPSDPHLPRRR